MISYQSLINKIIAFYDSHLQVKKVGSDFREQLENFATKDEKYPLVYICPVDATPSEMGFTTEINLEIYCFDIIQKDRANINVILSDCHLILNDLYNWFLNSDDYSFDIVGQPSMTPLNNDLLDYAAGWLMTVTCSINNYTDCQVPLQIDTPVINCDDCVRVQFTYDGIDYDFNVPKIEDNHFNLVTDLITIDITTDNDDWFIDLTGENLFYGNYYQTFNDGCPFFNDWIYNFGDTVENLVTSNCID